MEQRTGDQVAKIVLLFVAVAALNAFRRGELGDWAKAKFLNWGDPTPAQGPTVRSLLEGMGTTVAVAQGVGAGTAVAGAAGEAATMAGLVTVGNTKMSKGFAAKWIPLITAAKADGVILTGNAWRSNQRQFELRGINGCKGRENDRSCRGNPPTAIPGRSRHETGDAIDVNLTGPGGRGSPEYKWLAANAARFGVYNLPSEPWHWSTDGS